MVKNFKNLFLRNQEADDFETWYTASGTQVLPALYMMTLGWPWLFLLQGQISASVIDESLYSIECLYISKFVLILHILSTQVSDTGPMVLWFWFYYIPRKLCLWWGILFSRCPSVRVSVRDALFFSKILKTHWWTFINFCILIDIIKVHLQK